jgi:CRISPR-associated protein Cas1
MFRTSNILEKIIPAIEEVLAAGEITPPEMPPESILPAIPNPESLGDAGHRNK